MRLSLVASLLIAALGLIGCPEERKELVDQVGGAPKRQVDLAKDRLEKAGAAEAARLEEAAKLQE